MNRESDPHCTFPGCGWPVLSCDLDHVVPFPEGATSTENLHPLCRRHHRLKQHSAVQVERLDDGSTRWRLPTGDCYEVKPDAIGPCSDRAGNPPNNPPPDGPPTSPSPPPDP